MSGFSIRTKSSRKARHSYSGSSRHYNLKTPERFSLSSSKHLEHSVNEIPQSILETPVNPKSERRASFSSAVTNLTLDCTDDELAKETHLNTFKNSVAFASPPELDTSLKRKHQSEAHEQVVEFQDLELPQEETKTQKKPPKRRKPNPKKTKQCTFPVKIGPYEMKSEVLFPKSSWVNVNQNEYSEVSIIDTNQFAIVVISLKPSQNYTSDADNFQVIGTVLMSARERCQVSIHENTLYLSQWDSFIVPPGNHFNILNTGRSHVKIHLHINKTGCN